MVFMISSLRSVGVGFYFILKKFRLSLGGRTAKLKTLTSATQPTIGFPGRVADHMGVMHDFPRSWAQPDLCLRLALSCC